MSVQSTIESLLKLKPISRDLAEEVARKMGMNCDPSTGIVTGTGTQRLGGYIILCFESNFMDERRERLEEAKNAAREADAPTSDDLYCLYLGAFMNGIQGRVFVSPDLPMASRWAIAAGLRDGVAFREGRVDEDESFNDYEDFIVNLKAAVGGIQFAPV